MTAPPSWLLDPDQELSREEWDLLMAELPPEHQANVVRYLESQAAWRRTPATMAVHLSAGQPDAWRPWRYTMLLGEWFARCITGEDPFQIWMLPSQYGKGLSVETLLPTPAGWRKMGDLSVGDVVFGGDGRPCSVRFVSDDRWLDCYRVTLFDGSELVTDGDHQWRVWDSSGHDPAAWGSSRQKGAWRIVDTRALAARPSRYRVPLPGVLALPPVNLPIHPYALGVWLGDGSSASPDLTCADDEVLDHLAAVGEPARRRRGHPLECTWAGTRQAPSTFGRRLATLGVLGNKHLPDRYLWASPEQRLALLQGLMDTDGSAVRNQSGYAVAEFTSTNRRLAEGVRFLARSLGIRAPLAVGRATLNGKDCGPKYRVQFTTEVPIFRLSRKADLMARSPGPRRLRSRVGVRSVVPVPSVRTRCITVDSPDQTYLAGEGLSVTHNTSVLSWGILWALDRDPTLRLMYVSYDADRAVEVGGQTRDLAARYASSLRFDLRPDAKARGRWLTTAGGSLYCVGIKGGITGFPEDVVLGDDLIKGWQDAHSAAVRNFTWNVYRSQMRLRLQRVPRMVIAGTRWHEDDVQARLIASAVADVEADQWTPLRIPAVAEAPNPTASDPLLRLPDPLGRAPGEVLEPERFPLAEVRARAASLGSHLTAALEQQRPAPEEGNIIRRDWWNLVDFVPAKGDEWVTSWDMKLKEKKTGDYVAGQVWARAGSHCYLVDGLRGQWDQPTVICATILLAVRWPQVERHIMENTGNGPEVMESLRQGAPDYVVPDSIAGALGMSEAERAAVQVIRRRGLGGIIAENPKGDKVARVKAVSAFIEAGEVHVYSGWAGLASFMDECAAFDNGTHDDQVDAMSQALRKLHRRTAGNPGMTVPGGRLPTGTDVAFGGRGPRAGAIPPRSRQAAVVRRQLDRRQ